MAQSVQAGKVVLPRNHERYRDQSLLNDPPRILLSCYSAGVFSNRGTDDQIEEQ